MHYWYRFSFPPFFHSLCLFRRRHHLLLTFVHFGNADETFEHEKRTGHDQRGQNQLNHRTGNSHGANLSHDGYGDDEVQYQATDKGQPPLAHLERFVSRKYGLHVFRQMGGEAQKITLFVRLDQSVLLDADVDQELGGRLRIAGNARRRVTSDVTVDHHFAPHQEVGDARPSTFICVKHDGDVIAVFDFVSVQSFHDSGETLGSGIQLMVKYGQIARSGKFLTLFKLFLGKPGSFREQ